MKRLSPTLTTLAALLCALFFTMQAEAQTKITWKLKADETLNYRTTTTMKMTMDLGPKKMTTDVKTVMDMSWKVNKVNEDGSFDITQTFTRVQYDMNISAPANIKVKWDSSSDKAPEGKSGSMIAKMMKPMIGAKITMTLSPNGSPSNIKIPEEMTKVLTGNPLMKEMGEMFSKDGMKKMMSISGGFFPNKAIKAGDTWKQKIEMDTPFATMINKFQYTYKGQNSDELEEISPKFEIEAKPKENAPFKMNTKIKESKGTILFDNKAGRIKSSHIEFKMESNMTIGAKVMKQEMVNTTIFELVDPSEKRTGATKEKSRQTTP